MQAQDKAERHGDRYSRLLVIVALAVALSACTSPPIIMRNPATGQTADCGSRPQWWTGDVAANPGREADCIHDYRLQGWTRVPR
jgi:hypothetical protein